MEYWLIFLFILSLLLFAYNLVGERYKKYIFIITALWVIYFSAFRDGLGMDYSSYYDLCKRHREFFDINWFLTEPLFVEFTNFISKSIFTPILFFLVTSAIINYCVIYVYHKNRGFALELFFYICFPSLFIMSFNTVRQFVVAAVFLFISYFWFRDENSRRILGGLFSIRKLFLFALLLSLSLIHRSSIILIIVLLCSNKIGSSMIKPLWALLIIVLSFLLPISDLPFFSLLISFIDTLDYSMYLDYDNLILSKFSASNIYLNILILTIMYSMYNQLDKLCIKQYSKNKSFYILCYNMIFLCAVCNNLCANGFNIMYRLSIYFLMFLPILIGLLPKLINRYIVLSLIVIPTIILLTFRFYVGDSLLIPDQILDFSSIFK